MNTLPLLHDERHPPDALGRSECRLWLGRRNPETGSVTETDLGWIPYVPPPGKSYEAEWVGTYPDAFLRVTLPDGRVVEVMGICMTLAAGEWPRVEKKKAKPKKARAEPSPAPPQETLF